MTVEQSYLLYYFVLITTIFIIAFSDFLRKKNKYISFIFFWLALILPLAVAANRFGIGTDYFSYESMYYSLTNNSLIDSILYSGREPGWVILNYLVKYLFDDVRFIFIISAFLFLFFSFATIYRYRTRINISIATLILMCTLYNLSFNIVRQSLSMSIILFSIKYIEERKFFKFLAVVLLAGSFHYIALIFIPVYWLFNSNYREMTKIKKYALYLFFVIIVLFFEELFNALINFGGLFSKYEGYQLHDNTNIGIGVIIKRIPIILIILLSYKNLEKKDYFMSGITALYFISVILSFLAYKADYMGRIALYFEFFQIIILSTIVKNQDSLLVRTILIYTIIIYYIVAFTFNIIINNNGQTIPYISY